MDTAGVMLKQTGDAGRDSATSAASPSGRAEGLIAASQGSSRLYQKMASDPGRNSPDDPFAVSTIITHSPVRYGDDAERAHASEAQSEQYTGPALPAEGLYSGPSIEIIGAELYDKEL